MLDDQPSDWQRWYLPQLQKQVYLKMLAYAQEAGQVVAAGAEDGWNAGVQLVDAPLAAIRVDLAGSAPVLDRRQLEAMRQFLTYKMTGMATATANLVNQELGLVITGLSTPSQAATAIAGIVKEGGRRRALTVVRTELGRAFSTAAQGRMEQAVGLGVKGLQKQWRRSGKIHSRRSHDLADGQVQPVDKPFLVGGEAILYPRDPDAPPGQTVNCGCVSLPFVNRWEMVHPGEKPFTAAELSGNRAKTQTAGMRAAGVRQWAETTLSGRRPADGEWQTLGSLPTAVVDFLRQHDVEPATLEIAISDKLLKRPARPAKVAWDRDISREELVNLLGRMDFPKAILWGEQDNNLHYVFEIPGEERLAKLVIRVRAREDRSRLTHNNYVISGGMIERDILLKQGQYTPIMGGI
ncbi:MAG: phage head morphogenesis protein [Magnetococcus sp. MYC-9]